MDTFVHKFLFSLHSTLRGIYTLKSPHIQYKEIFSLKAPPFPKKSLQRIILLFLTKELSLKCLCCSELYFVLLENIQKSFCI